MVGVCSVHHPHSYDEHWKPASLYCAVCSFPYNHILHFENIQQEEKFFAEEMSSSDFIQDRNEKVLPYWLRKTFLANTCWMIKISMLYVEYMKTTLRYLDKYIKHNYWIVSIICDIYFVLFSIVNIFPKWTMEHIYFISNLKIVLTIHDMNESQIQLNSVICVPYNLELI